MVTLTAAASERLAINANNNSNVMMVEPDVVGGVVPGMNPITPEAVK